MEDGKEALSVSCLPSKGNGTANLEGGRLHVAWGVALFRLVIDAPVVSSTAFLGTYTRKFFGVSREAPMPIRGRKLAPSAGTADTTEQGAALRTALAAIASGAAPPPDESTRRKFGSLFGGAPAMSAASLGELGAPVQVIHLGESSPPQAPPGGGLQPGKPFEPFTVYDVEFANGQRLCGLLTEATGKVNLLCV
jgi:hypothetical protein